MNEAPLVLASASPRRRGLLSQIGLTFEAAATNVDETPPKGVAPHLAVQAIAERKLDAYLTENPRSDDQFVLAVDTDVFLNGRLFGKPVDAESAKRMLHELQGTSHIVYSALALAAPGARRLRTLVASKVRISPLTQAQIDAYVATGEPLDKAGAYAVQGQGAAFIESVEGDYTNVVGLPLRPTLRLLHQAGFPLPAHLRI